MSPSRSIISKTVCCSTLKRKTRAGSLAARAKRSRTSRYITNRLIFQQDPTAPKIMVDISGYRAQAREALVKKAKDAAEKVRRWGDVVELEPLSAFDRRIIHQALKDDPNIETHSVEVQGTDKKAILLRPKH